MGGLMYDAVNVENIPADATLIGVYVDGIYQTETAARARFPRARLVTITVRGAAGAEMGDCEKYDLTPAALVAWSVRERAAGRPGGGYANASTWAAPVSPPNDLRPLAEAFGAAPKWLADYDEDPAIPAGYVAKQYHGGPTAPFDISSTIAGWPDPDLPPSVQHPPTSSTPDPQVDLMHKQLVTLNTNAAGSAWTPAPVAIAFAKVIAVSLNPQNMALGQPPTPGDAHAAEWGAGTYLEVVDGPPGTAVGIWVSVAD